jgi:hypothetical protein
MALDKWPVCQTSMAAIPARVTGAELRFNALVSDFKYTRSADNKAFPIHLFVQIDHPSPFAKPP